MIARSYCDETLPKPMEQTIIGMKMMSSSKHASYFLYFSALEHDLTLKIFLKMLLLLLFGTPLHRNHSNGMLFENSFRGQQISHPGPQDGYLQTHRKHFASVLLLVMLIQSITFLYRFSTSTIFTCHRDKSPMESLV